MDCRCNCKEVAVQLNTTASHKHTHTHALCPQGVMRNETEVVPAFEVQPLGATHMNLWNAMLSIGAEVGGDGRGCDKRASLLSIIQGGAESHSSHVGLTWGQGYIKGIECRCSVWAAVAGGREEGSRGITTRGVRCQVTGEAQLNAETKRGVEADRTREGTAAET